MHFGYREVCLDHDPGPRHPESPDRLRAVRQGLKEVYGVEYAAPDSASVEDVRAVHDPDYVEKVREFCGDGGGDWDTDTVAVGKTWDAALASAGIATWVAERALDGADGRDTPFALGRPPGHHAVEDDAMGFCFFNNNAVAAQWALDHRDVDRVAILDWDVHHGNGIQDIFYDRGDVFFASFHEEGIYPGTGAVGETGEGDGERRTLNVPFPPGTRTSGYLAALDDLVLPAFAAYDPDLLLVSAGFDAHEHDPISRIRVSTEGYGLIAQRLQKFAEWVGAPLGFVLEGGYGLDTLTDSIRTVHEVFDGYQPEPPTDPVQAGARSVIDEVHEEGFDCVETPDFGPAIPTADPEDDATEGTDGDTGDGDADAEQADAEDADAENAP